MSRITALAAKLAARIPQTQSELERPRAAVALIFAPEPDSLLLIQRAEREGDRWSGQLALPGGRWNPTDVDLAATARRETHEEVGIDLRHASLLGSWDDLEPRTPVLPPIVVRPFVYALAQRAELILNQEVAGAWWIELEAFWRPGTYGPTEYSRYGTVVRSSAYHLDIGLLWGMTERILTPILDLIR